MHDEPSNLDDALLARLNNLKGSSVSVDSSKSLALPPSAGGASELDDTPEDLIARFERLCAGSPLVTSRLHYQNLLSTILAVHPHLPSRNF